MTTIGNRSKVSLFLFPEPFAANDRLPQIIVLITIIVIHHPEVHYHLQGSNRNTNLHNYKLIIYTLKWINYTKFQKFHLLMDHDSNSNIKDAAMILMLVYGFPFEKCRF